jgi:glucokinase-like ROK family protein
MRKATRQQTKEHNRNLVLKTIFENESISRAEIARQTRLTRTTVSDLVNELIYEGLVNEVGYGASLGGKSPILLSLIEDSRYMIGLDLAYNQFRGAIVNLRGKIREMVSLPVVDPNGEEALALVYQLLDQLLKDASLPLVGIGIGTPGLVNTAEGIVVDAVNLDWKDLPLAGLLQDRYHLPVFVLNDSQAAAMGEFTFGGDYKPDENLVVINVRHGIGAGIIISGRLFQGDNGGAGEIGHVVVVPDGGLFCRCGKRGCLETVASTQAILKRARELVREYPGSPFGSPYEAITMGAIEQAFFSNDPLAEEIVIEAGRYMGLAISSLVGTLNINKIVLIGDMTRFGQPWLDAIRGTVHEMSLQGMVQKTQISLGKLDESGIILGASALLTNSYALLMKLNTETAQDFSIPAESGSLPLL